MNVPPFIEAKIAGRVNKVIEVTEAVEVVDVLVEFVVLIHVAVFGVRKLSELGRRFVLKPYYILKNILLIPLL